MRKIISLLLIGCIFIVTAITAMAENKDKNGAEYRFYSDAGVTVDEDIDSAYLIEASTGKVLFAKNEFSSYPPASVTKIMTLLLVCEALDMGMYSLTDMVTISANAASMGGSQVFLEEGERICVEDLIKSAVIASGNDASVALAELTAGSEEAFVKKMNQRADELGLKNTNFENTTGLDDTTVNHFTCAADIGTMSRELIKHDFILKYSSTWQDSIRNGEFVLTNTNRLVRYYDGCNGLKTGSTDKAGFCISATAKRGNMQLIAVVMGASSSAQRNETARTLLDFGFANYALYEKPEQFVEEARVKCGTKDYLSLYSTPFICVVEKSKISSVELFYNIPEVINAPINKGEVVGSIIYKIEEIGRAHV